MGHEPASQRLVIHLHSLNRGFESANAGDQKTGAEVNTADCVAQSVSSTAGKNVRPASVGGEDDRFASLKLVAKFDQVLRFVLNF